MRSTKNIAENRIFQQLLVSHTLGIWDFTLRTRLEQRHRSQGPGSPEQSQGKTSWAIRFRQLAQASVSLRQDRPWMLMAWDEVLVNLNSTNYVTEPGFAQNRAFLGIAQVFVNGGPMLRAGAVRMQFARLAAHDGVCSALRGLSALDAHVLALGAHGALRPCAADLRAFADLELDTSATRPRPQPSIVVENAGYRARTRTS
jgi:hypothetical protein